MTPRIRTLTRDEVEIAVDFAAKEGWNPGLHDADAFYAADPDGFLGAELDGRIVGCISAVAYGREFGFIGFYIVVPPLRGQGIGMALWRAGMERLAGMPVGLDGVPDQQANYRRSGFELAWQNARFAGRASEAAPGADHPFLVPLASIDPAVLAADDRRVFPAPRDSFLRAWTTMPDSHGLAWVEHGRIRGWGVIRRCRTGHKVAPLVADDAGIAGALLDALVALVARVAPGDEVFLDVPLPNTAAVALARGRGMEVVFETARMVANGAPPSIEIERVFGITSFELG
jgi:ribosomal protein S18 acetylase RimI-like enzyme